MTRLLLLMAAMGLALGHAHAAECKATELAGTYQTNMGELQCSAAGNRRMNCCFGKDACDIEMIMAISSGGVVAKWIDKKTRKAGRVMFDVSPDCRLSSGKPAGRSQAGKWEIGSSTRAVAQAEEPKPEKQADKTEDTDQVATADPKPKANQMPDADQYTALPSRCALDQVAEFYETRSVALECRVAAERLHCCQIKWHRARPEDFSSFDPLNPPTDLRADDFGYKIEEPQCNTNSLSLVLRGEEAVGWKDLTATPDKRPRVRLPLDESCRLASGTIFEPEEKRLPIHFDLSRANVKTGEPDMQYEIGQYWLGKGRTRYAITHYTAAAREGHAQSQFELARIFENGASSVRRNLQEADRLYALAAAQGIEGAQRKTKKRDIARRNLQALVSQAEAGDIETQYKLGKLYAAGETVDMNWAKAVHWLKRASDADHALAMMELGWIYIYGAGGMEPDKAAGISLLEQSIVLGNDWALVNLARVIYRGEIDVTTRTGARARELLNRAQRSSNTNVVSAANYWLSILDGDRSNVARRNTIKQREKTIDAMSRAAQGTADAAMEGLQNID